MHLPLWRRALPFLFADISQFQNSRIAATQARKLADLQAQLEVMRARFRSDLVGIWSTPDTIPMGDCYGFYADGQGFWEETRGLGGTRFNLQWRAAGDWKIEIKINYPPDYWRQFHDEAEGPFEPVENAWELVHYDFAIDQSGYGPRIVLYNFTNSRGELEFESCCAPLMWVKEAPSGALTL